MKIFAFFACMLAVFAMAYSADYAEVKRFSKDVLLCSKELNVLFRRCGAFDYEFTACLIRRDKELTNSEGAIIKENVEKRFAQYSEDKGLAEYAQKRVSDCYIKAFSGNGTIEEKNKNYINCGLPLTILFERIDI